MIFTDLVLDNGGLIRVECHQKFEDDFYDSLENEMKLGGWWSPSRFNGCVATYLGMRLNRVNMGRVVAML